MKHADFLKLVEQGPKVAVPMTLRNQRGWNYFILALLIWIFDRWGGFASELNWYTILAVVMILIDAYSIRREQLRARAFPGTHLESLPARILEISSGARALGRLPTQVLIEMPSGERRKLRYQGQGADQWKEGGYGVAHVKANLLVEFQRLSV